MDRLIIRNEMERDCREVETLIREAFWNLNVPGCDEHYLAHILRSHKDFIPELDLVAELDGRIIGYAYAHRYKERFGYRFCADPALCTGCGRCAKLCPLHNISLNGETALPRWNGRCTHCLACYHGCPHHAIGYGKFTKGKGQVAIIV